MRALVTGCAGFIGSHLTESLLGDGHEVVGLDCFNDNYGRSHKLGNLTLAREWDAFMFVPLDLARGDLTDLVEEADVVFHLAGEPGVRASWGDRFELYLRNNVLATQHLLEAARLWPHKRFVFASSSSIYGQADSFPTHEGTLPKPFSPYGVTKLDAENLCLAYGANYGVDVAILRYFSVFGPRQRPDMAFNIFCHAALEGRPISVFGDGKQTRDFTFVADIVRATRLAADVAEIRRPVYNVGGGVRSDLASAIDLIAQLAGRKLDVHHLEHRHGDVKDTLADASAIQEDLGFQPQTTLAEGLAEEFEWVADVTARSTDKGS